MFILKNISFEYVGIITNLITKKNVTESEPSTTFKYGLKPVISVLVRDTLLTSVSLHTKFGQHVI